MTITGIPTFISFSRCCSSRPSISGMRTSVTMQPSCASGSALRKATADSCTRTARPAVLSRKASDWRTSASSSMTWTTWLAGTVGVLFPGHLQSEVENRTTLGRRLHPDLPAVRFDDGAADRETEPHALALGRHERLEQMSRHLGRQSATGIGHAHLRHAVAAGDGRDLELARARYLEHDLDRVADQVDQHLLDLDAVGQNDVRGRIEAE